MTTQTSHRDHGATVATQYGYKRSPKWPGVAEEHLRHQPHCVACNGTNSQAKVQVHHIFPFHYCRALGRPDLELDQRNLITLCEDEAGHPADNHHLLVGHLDDFESSNLDVEVDAKTTFHGMSAIEIRNDPRWKQKENGRLKPLKKMTEQDKRDFQAKMNERFPKQPIK